MPSYRGITHEPADLPQKSATARAYHHLKNQVLSCELPPGEVIYENEIAAALEMSKTPVREALGMLVHEGFVDVRPRQGYWVTDISLSDVQEVFHLRSLLEPAAAELAARRMTDDQLAQLRELATPTPGVTYADQVGAGTEFHVLMAEASGSARLAASLRHLLEEIHRFFFLGLDLGEDTDHVGAGHLKLVEALAAGDGAGAADLARAQVDRSRTRIFDAIVKSMSDGGSTLGTNHVKLRSQDT